MILQAVTRVKWMWHESICISWSLQKQIKETDKWNLQHRFSSVGFSNNIILSNAVDIVPEICILCCSNVIICLFTIHWCIIDCCSWHLIDTYIISVCRDGLASNYKALGKELTVLLVLKLRCLVNFIWLQISLL